MFKKILNFLFVSLWVLLAIDPHDFNVWFMENILVVTVFPLVLRLDKKYKFSNFAYFGLFVFVSSHLVGAYFTYLGITTLDNVSGFFAYMCGHYDKFVHFLFGFLMFLPFFEISKNSGNGVNMSRFLSILLILSASSVYELLEWAAVMAVHPESGGSEMITHGDEWDTQKDIALALAGSLFALLLHRLTEGGGRKAQGEEGLKGFRFF